MPKNIYSQEIKDAAYTLYVMGNPVDLIKWHMNIPSSVLDNEIKIRGKRPDMRFSGKKGVSKPLRDRTLEGGHNFKHLIIQEYRHLY